MSDIDKPADKPKPAAKSLSEADIRHLFHELTAPLYRRITELESRLLRHNIH